ncbi:hypothetical protein, partial [Escherichia coli]|uniref:hypothetical protein n=1 Tax=Escherichia coli TaxID=562 RepID=UPI001C568D8D
RKNATGVIQRIFELSNVNMPYEGLRHALQQLQETLSPTSSTIRDFFCNFYQKFPELHFDKERWESFLMERVPWLENQQTNVEAIVHRFKEKLNLPSMS